ncbi:Nucleoporin [Penicillium bovifimosum]|uniref:Nucleoporin n=1 Tax=Penicillium bovifimosum TaxID=126998 RepID=A0A9W9H2W4_9EURO|nr:Nucleoporin [Penicillium bovifimosum]KAJ5135876.1 Nucleoporin [Penicillium bovifimosum]
MAKIYKDSRVDLRPYSPTTVANIQIPTLEPVARRPRFSISSTSDDVPIAKDEDEFSRRYLATQGDIYFRKRKVYPRTFLWRVINDNKVLEIQCADLTKGGTEVYEYNVTLRLGFQEQILPFGVELSDSEDHELISVFVITASKHLHTLSLRPEFFRRTSSIDENVSDWCKTTLPAPLAFSNPHRLHASSPLELFISLDNGALLRLTRRAGDDGSHWSPLTLDERTWGSSIRGLVKWNAPSSIRHDGRNLDLNVANAIATTSDETYVFAICLNHTLKIWNLATNKLAATKDLLGRSLQDPDLVAYTLNPAEASFMRVFNAERAMDGGHRFYVVTYSPFEDGRFKFWAVKGGLTSELVIEELFAENVFRPVDPDATGNMFWSIADFQVKTREEGKGMELWVLWRNHGLYQLYTLHFDLQTLVTDWSTKWVSTTFESHRQESPPSLVMDDVVDPTEKWLQGREASLVGLVWRTEKELALGGTTLLHNRIGSVSSEIRRRGDGLLPVAEDLNKRRFEPISLAYDSYTDMPWLLLSDSCAVWSAKDDGPLETSQHSKGAGSALRNGLWTVESGDRFRKSFSAELDGACRAALQAEIFSEPSSSILDRMESFRERCDFTNQISNKAFDNLDAALSEYMRTDFTFVDGEWEPTSTSDFDASKLFSTLVDLLREYEMMNWLSSNVRKCPDSALKFGADSSMQRFSTKESNSKTKSQRTASILEDLFVTDIKPQQAIDSPQSYTLTLGIRDVVAWITREGEVNYQHAVAHIQCDLIAKNNIDLAWDFLRFQASTSWSTYIKGRLHVAMSEFDAAAIYFRKAAYLLSSGKPMGNLSDMSAELLDILDVDCFHNGLAKYYQHVLSIFEKVRPLTPKSGPRKDAEYPTVRDDLLSRLFTGALKTCQFDQAYSALARLQDLKLQKSQLTELISTILAVSGPGTAGLKQILRFPTTLVPSIASFIDEILVHLTRKQTNNVSWLDAENKHFPASPDYTRILQAYRIARCDYRGAAEIAYRNVQRLRKARDAPSSALIRKGREAADAARSPVEEDDAESKEIRHELLSLINLLACVDKSEAYILVENGPPTNAALIPSLGRRASAQADEDGNISMGDADAASPTPVGGKRRSSNAVAFAPDHRTGGSKSSAPARRDSTVSFEVPATNPLLKRRIIVTLEHLRREFQSELDRVSRIERGDWEFGLSDEEKEDVDNDDTMVF